MRSASQVATFETCPRKWAFRYIDKVEVQVTKGSIELGKACHAQLEVWLGAGTPLDLTTEAGQIALSGIHWLPTPKAEGLETERHFVLQMGGHTWQGYKDFEVAGPVPLVGDHKTTRDFRWAKSEADLRTDPQACLYAADAMVRYDVPVVDLLWVYYRTTGARRSEPRRARVTREDIAPTLERMVAVADEMAAIVASGKPAKEVRMLPACNAYGGCEYLQICNPTPQEMMRSIMSQQKAFDFVAELKARQAGAINPPAAAPPPAPPVVWNTATQAYEFASPQVGTVDVVATVDREREVIGEIGRAHV